jgi:tRNA(Arg) A34 adenosine deaminase TadA
MADTPTYPPKPPGGVLNGAWDQPVSSLVLLPVPKISPEQQERHILYSLLTMALVAGYWNGNKFGPTGTYPWREKQKLQDGSGYKGGDYLGHNIACIGVDGRGRVIDFDFNHNYIFDSSVEHAEARLVRRIFSLAQLNDEWMTHGHVGLPVPLPFTNLLNAVTIYTSLESCTQCSGIMALGQVKAVVFLQHDPSAFSIGNILSNLGCVNGVCAPPTPISANLFGLDCFDRLQAGFAEFTAGVAQRPFYIGTDGTTQSTPSISSYLCTDDAYSVFSAAQQQLQGLNTVKHPSYRPKAKDGSPIPGALSNAAVLAEVKRFLNYAINCGYRGTPHRL